MAEPDATQQSTGGLISQPGARAPVRMESADGAVEMDTVDDAVVVRVSGALDLALAPKLRQMIDRATRSGGGLLIIDLTGTDFLASAGMAVLLHAHRRLGQPAGADSSAMAVRVVVVGRTVLRPLQLTGLDTELDIYPNLPEALRGR